MVLLRNNSVFMFHILFMYFHVAHTCLLGINYNCSHVKLIGEVCPMHQLSQILRMHAWRHWCYVWNCSLLFLLSAHHYGSFHFWLRKWLNSLFLTSVSQIWRSSVGWQIWEFITVKCPYKKLHGACINYISHALNQFAGFFLFTRNLMPNDCYEQSLPMCKKSVNQPAHKYMQYVVVSSIVMSGIYSSGH